MNTKSIIKLIFSANAVVAIMFLLSYFGGSINYTSNLPMLISCALLISCLSGIHHLNKKVIVKNG
ncbi:hypothetical protein [Acinetobacter variabilis]|uniref:hypothetical protein n=1 Tax=Acinetobacter variabilis TaxID=70346 RepID=UPI0028AF2D87|nr:hypothetical protein [Acinetobacter variabilis]